MSNDLNTLALMSGLSEGGARNREYQRQMDMMQGRMEYQNGMLGERLDSQAALKQAAIAAQEQRLTQSLGSKSDMLDKNLSSKSNLQNGRFNFQEYLKHYQTAVNFMGKQPGLEQTESAQSPTVQSQFANNEQKILAGLDARSPVQQVEPPVQDNPAPDITTPIDAVSPSTKALVDPNATPSIDATGGGPASPGGPLVPSGPGLSAAPVASADPITPATVATAQSDASLANKPVPASSAASDPNAPATAPAPTATFVDPTSLLGLSPGLPPQAAAPTHDPDTDPQGVVPSSTPHAIFNPDPFKVAKEKQGNERVYQGAQRLLQTGKENAVKANEFGQAQTTIRRGQDMVAATGGLNRDAATNRVQMNIDAAMQRQKLGISDADFRAKYTQGQENNRAGMKSGAGGPAVDPVKYYKQLHSIQADQTQALSGLSSLTKPGGVSHPMLNKLDGTPLKDPATGQPVMSTPPKPRIVIGSDGNPDLTQSDPNAVPLYNQLRTRLNTARAAEKAYTKPVPSATAQGDAIGDVTSRLPGESQGAYIHRCQARARVAYQDVTSAYNPYFGKSALVTLNNFRQAGLAKPYNPSQPLPPGSILFSSKMGGDNGHVQVVGVNGTRFDQYGQNKFGLGNFDYYVPPPGAPKAQPQPQLKAQPKPYSPYSFTGIPNKSVQDIFR